MSEKTLLSLNLPPDYAHVHAQVRQYLETNQGPLKLPLLGLQKKSVAHMTAARYALLWDDMGLGKTAQCLAVNALAKADKTLIFCPNNIKEVWVAEISKFTGLSPASIYIGRSSDLITLTARLLDRFKFFIFNYEVLRVSGKTPDIRPAIFDHIDHLILDESHHIRNSYTQDFISLYRNLYPKPPKLLTISTGTPIDRFMGEVWPYLMLMDLNPAVSERVFHTNYPNQELFNEDFAHLRSQKKKGEEVQNDYAGYNKTNFPQVVSFLKNHVVRREITDVGEMPRLHTQDLFIPDRHFNVDWNEVLRKFAWLAQLQNKKQSNLKPDEMDSIAGIQKLRTDIAARKAWFTVQQVKLALQAQGSAVFFSEFIRPLKEAQHWLNQEGINSALVCGSGMSLVDRSANIDNFKAGKFPVLLATFGAMAEGVNLQTSNVVVFNDLPWQPLRLQQAQRRVWRIGQARECYNLTMLCRGDMFVLNSVLRKQGMIAELDKELRKINKEKGLV